MQWVKWKTSALYDLAEIIDYIEQYNTVASSKLHQQIVHVTENLSQHPYLYRSGRVPGTREIVVHPNYLVVYTIDELQIEILRVLHARQEYP
ncbi:type II toxin-antitoxin system RelE/ParE family toxin [Candidatus Symbiopectobacterium sp. NZEC127]|uniref:type II toxin-antitoxin system RelE/ParE family toxin n=1 Tax=Candidatus Symbiopectobacterium sp. NZEC127 TaxID=2820472 RepID=UPI002227A819|nr:type II toxin-antitoxin system RelE/ParE family toxin [Candidatus Symbiopectobacterium sp. NZEC127]MCW2488255.1 type II toxin-antitoxin system RelE/ParE family toxin [Candidatus Symbiopectobacterium sp. NZEC127]